jgi:hypothetical protein
MAARIDLIVQLAAQGEISLNVFSYYTATGFTNPAAMQELCDVFETNVINNWAGFMPIDVAFVDITARSPSYPFPLTSVVNGSGVNDLADNLYMPAWLPLVLKKSISSNLVGDTGLPYTGLRPVRNGRVFLSWLPEGFSSSIGFESPGGALGTAWTAFLASLTDPITFGSDTWTPVVPGEPLEATETLPSRPYVMGVIDAFVPRKFTKLSTRED